MKVCHQKSIKRSKRSAGLEIKLAVRLPRTYPWKILDAYVRDHEQVFEADERALLSQIIRDRDIHAYLLLEDLWGLQNTVSMCPEVTDLYALRVKYQVCSLLKKFQFETERSARRASAKQKFYDAEIACEAYNHSGYKKLLWGETEYEAEVFTHFRSFLHKVLGDKLPPFAELSEWSRHGPGANLDTNRVSLKLTSQYHKYAEWPYSCTQQAVPYARLLIMKDKRWLGALEDSYREHFKIPKHMILDQEAFWENVLSIVVSNRVTFVPKNALTERTIAIEPAMNLMLQLGVDGFIRRRLKRWGVDLDDQSKNQYLAGLGSCDDSKNGFVTIDLKAASESIALKLVEVGCPQPWYDYLLKLRCPGWVIEEGGLPVEGNTYHKISSMGNGYTFALESAIFAAVIYAVMKTEGGVVDTEKFAVFGDDLIVQKKYAQGVISLLSRCGLQLNLDKSFLKGPTRESCGSDWFNGKPVRPVFIKEYPEDVKGLLNDRNRLKRMSSLYYGSRYSCSAVKQVEKWIPDVIKTREFAGPYSDTEFDSYMHSSTPTKWVDGAHIFSRVVYKPRTVSASAFLFRKLMHDLRPSSENPYATIAKALAGEAQEASKTVYPTPRKLVTGGNRFTVHNAKRAAVGKTSCRSDVWAEQYNYLMPRGFGPAV